MSSLYRVLDTLIRIFTFSDTSSDYYRMLFHRRHRRLTQSWPWRPIEPLTQFSGFARALAPPFWITILGRGSVQGDSSLHARTVVVVLVFELSGDRQRLSVQRRTDHMLSTIGLHWEPPCPLLGLFSSQRAPTFGGKAPDVSMDRTLPGEPIRADDALRSPLKGGQLSARAGPYTGKSPPRSVREPLVGTDRQRRGRRS